jgi:3-deoxy-D-manno-octulosonate 8-phosphate phosphatase (KDO 8-P phosphatase)
MARLGVTPAETACVGDDTPDLPMLEKVGLAIAVADAHPALRPVVHWVTTAPGGRGAVREVCDLIIRARAS